MTPRKYITVSNTPWLGKWRTTVKQAGGGGGHLDMTLGESYHDTKQAARKEAERVAKQWNAELIN